MLGLSIPEVAERVRNSRDAATIALIARMTAAPGEARSGLIDALVGALKDAGVWAKLDLLYVLAAHDAQAARLNWVSASYALAAVNSPGFLADRGYAGDGSTSYLDSGFQPGVTAGSLAARNDVHLGAWSLGNVDPSGADAGSRNLYILPRSSGMLTSRCNDTATGTVTVANALGHSLLSRTGPAGYARYRDGASLGDATAASSAPDPTNLLVGAKSSSTVPNNYTSRRIAAVSCGSGLSAGEVAALRAALAVYLAALGAM
jgi:hypothetical protein